jgi:hypothetical protein
MDRIEKYESKINPDNPVNPVYLNVVSSEMSGRRHPEVET